MELAASLALVANRSNSHGRSYSGGYIYPRETVEGIWQDVLLFQV